MSTDSKPIRFTIGVIAYNEAANIEKSIRSVFIQELSGFELDKVIVISSASTDGTDDIVKSLMGEYPKVLLIPQIKREGKNSAVNCFLDAKETEIVVILNADNTLGNVDSLKKLLEPFRDEKNGIVGGHPVAMNDPRSIAGFASKLEWTMHHHVALRHPKIGELIAYRDIGTRLPLENQSDEDLIRMRIEAEGYSPVYAPGAIVLNRGPETVSDFIKQRIRVNIGQSYLIRDGDYYNPTRDFRMLYGAMVDAMKELGFHPVKLFAAVVLEEYCRLKAKAYVRRDKGDLNIWDPVSTTKKL